jgi:pyruvate/2-oxoglutarate dehydrogenase complex dihydrolipoamide dehydrogenase (E3) component
MNTTAKTFDAIIIGSGQGGTPLCKKLAKAGWKTALVEKKFIGGTCVNVGCTPTKSMVASARMAFLAGNGKKLGVSISEVGVDLPAIVSRKNEIVEQFRNGAQKALADTAGLTLLFGEACFTGTKELEIQTGNGNKEKLTADYIFIDTGGAPAVPTIEGIDSITYLTSDTILDLTEIPKHLLIVGSSYIGCEFGQMFSRFGSSVTMLEQSSQFLPREDRDIADCMRSILLSEGIKIQTNASLKKVENWQNNTRSTITVSGTEEVIVSSHILFAIGRTPSTKQLAVSKTGVETDEHGYIKVNAKLETSQPGIYALGDVKGGPAFTHISYNDYVVIAGNLLENANVSIEGRPVPYCMFTDPQLARIGMSEEEANKKGLHVKVARLGMENVARAIETGETSGMIKAIVDAATKQILGAAVIGEQGGEIMSLLQMAMAGGISVDRIKDMIFAHPLYAESLNNLFVNF